MKAFFANRSLFSKLIIIFVVTAIIPIIIISVFSYRSTEQQLLNVAYSNMNSTNQQVNNNIDIQLDIFRHVSSSIYTDENLKAYLIQNYTKDYDFIEAYRYINARLYSMLAANGNIAGIYLHIYNKTIPSDGFFIEHLNSDPLPSSFLAELEKTYGNEKFSSITKDKQGNNIFYLGRVLNYNSQSNPYGLLTVAIREDLLYKMIEKENANKSVYILDQNNVIVSTKHKSTLNKNFSDVTGIKISPGSSGSEIVKVDSQLQFFVYNTMPHGWKTISVMPYKTIVAEAQSTTNMVLLIALVSIFLATVMIIFISQYLSLRLKNLKRQTSKIESGDFNSLITDTSQDEIGALGGAFNRMSSHLKILIDELYVKEIAKRDAELYALQSQINPHFLYNTLSVISSLAIRNGDKETSQIVNHLSRFYQTSLNKGKEYITIEKELEITKHYIAIQHMRFGNLFTEHWDINPQFLQQKILKLLIQPFIENAINHAIKDENKSLNIYIRLFPKVSENHRVAICFEIEDDGAGISKKMVTALMERQNDVGYGINNVHERIQIAYGKEYGVFIKSQLNKGTKVQILLPEQPGENDNGRIITAN